MIYDVIILGAGPAGLSAGIYAARAGLNTAIIEKGQVGGQISLTLTVDNYPGADNVPTGPDLTEKMLGQATSFGSEFISDTINSIGLDGDIKVLKSDKEEYRTKTIIYAAGAHPRKLNIPGEKEYTGKGVAYCATCDGAFFQGADIYVVGAGDAAVEEAIFLTKFGKRVIILARGDELTAANIIKEKAFNNEKIEIKYNTEVKEVGGGAFLEELVLENNKTGERELVQIKEGEPAFGFFVFIGYIPNTELVKDLVELERGYIKASEDTKTNVPGIFAAGDVRTKRVRQVITAASDGAVAAIEAQRYIENLE